MRRDLISFAGIVIVAIAVLASLNALPAWLGGEPRGVVRYDSVEALEARHRPLWHPARVPPPWTWPPSRIRVAVGEPDWVEFEFGTGDDSLIVCQSIAGAHSRSRPGPAAEIPARLLPGGELLQAADTSIAGRDARLRRLALDAGTIVHEMWWREGAARIMLRLPGGAERLPAVAQTLIGRR